MNGQPVLRKVVGWTQHSVKVPARVQWVSGVPFPSGYEMLRLPTSVSITLICGHVEEAHGEIPPQLMAWPDQGEWPCFQCGQSSAGNKS